MLSVTLQITTDRPFLLSVGLKTISTWVFIENNQQVFSKHLVFQHPQNRISKNRLFKRLGEISYETLLQRFVG
jgi:hypothetical protein